MVSTATNDRLMRRATYAAVGVALSLITMKAVAFAITGSVAMLATLFDSVLDMAASVLNLFAVRAALTPADHDHRFGHGKAEAMAGLGQATIIILSAIYILWEAGSRLIDPVPVSSSGIGIVVTVIAIGLTLALVAYQTRVVRQTNSLAIAADSIHYKGDLLMNLAVIAALALSAFPGFVWADPVFGIMIACFIAYSAWQIADQSIQQLMDQELPEDERDKIRSIVLADEDVQDMHDLRTRMAGTKLFIQFHLELDGGMSLTRAHEVADRVEAAVRHAFPGSEVLFLASPVAYGLPADTSVERIDTHISVVFLAGDFAYKLKKRLDLVYLDFTTLDKRRKACENELRLNQRTAPALYLEVMAVVEIEEGLSLAAQADLSDAEIIVDWVVKMARFDQSDLLSNMADRGALSVPMVESLAKQVARFHKEAEVCPTAGGPPRFAEILESNRKNFGPFIGTIYPQTLIDQLGTQYAKSLEQLSALIESRRAVGWVRHCHGDLHLNNVVCLDGEPVPFDCIEFNDQFARIDILYDLGFLLMDLAFRATTDRGLADHANTAMNAYLQAQTLDDVRQTLSGLEAMRFFMSIRASVRSHVSARMFAANSQNPQLVDLALAYAEFAKDLLIQRDNGLYAVGGLSGTGKTTIAKLLAPHLGGAAGAVHLRTDTIRKRLAGVDDADRLPSEAYTQAASDRVYEEMGRLAGIALDAGQTVICDAVFAKPDERDAIETVAASRSTPFAGIWLEAPENVLESRVKRRSEIGTDASDADVDVVRQQLSYELGDLDWPVVQAAGTSSSILTAVQRALNLTRV
eukprot:s1_g826.t1